MSFSGRTPESLLPRSDSKNPATTCKGLTANGRPCRRALASPPTPKSSPAPSPSRRNSDVGDRGVLAVLDEENAAAFYCWQHKDQALSLAQQSAPDAKTTLYPLLERNSLDSLAERVGVLDLDSEVGGEKRRHRRHKSQNDEPKLTKRDTLPPGWHDMQGPLMTVPEEFTGRKPRRRTEYVTGRPQSNVSFSWGCCIRAEPSPPLVRRRRPQAQGGYASPAQMEIKRKPIPSTSTPQRPSPQPLLSPSTSGQAAPATSNSQTQTLLSLIPANLSPQTTSQLLAELSKPVSPADEAGYIYIFWLTPQSDDAKPDDETASSLIDDSDSDSDDGPYTPTRSRGPPAAGALGHHRRQTEALRRYASVRKPTATSSAPKRTVLLKIGRAANVHRRMTQWSKQCGQDISLVRYYPYETSSRAESGVGGGVKKCPHIHRVERLVHLELAEKRVASEPCEVCGREHKEWFEIEASRKGLRAVDRAVKRWIRWAEHLDDGAIADCVMAAPERARLNPVVDGYY
jgi:hypothetical protein